MASTRMRLVALSGALALMGAGRPLTAQVKRVSAAEPASVATALQDAGYRAAPGKDDTGDPKVTSTMSGHTVTIDFYGCNNNKNCRSLQFYSSWETGGKLTLEKVNEWNLKKRWGKLAMDDEKDPVITLDIDTSPNGFDAELFQSLIRHWEAVIADLRAFVGD